MTDPAQQRLSAPVRYYVRVQDGMHVPKLATGTRYPSSAHCKVSFSFPLHSLLSRSHDLGTHTWGGWLHVLRMGPRTGAERPVLTLPSEWLCVWEGEVSLSADENSHLRLPLLHQRSRRPWASYLNSELWFPDFLTVSGCYGPGSGLAERFRSLQSSW